MEYVYRTQGTCSTNIELNVEDGVVKEVAFWGGCNGNLQGLSRLVKGMKVEDVIKKLEGVRCSGRPTSCPDQLCHALHEIHFVGGFFCLPCLSLFVGILNQNQSSVVIYKYICAE